MTNRRTRESIAQRDAPSVPMVRRVILVVAVALLGACSPRTPAPVEISTLQQLRGEVESVGVDCADFEPIDPSQFAAEGDFVTEAASCGSGVMIAVLPARLEMSPVVQSVFRASTARTGDEVSAVAHGDTWIVSCDTDTALCDSIAEELKATSARQES